MQGELTPLDDYRSVEITPERALFCSVLATWVQDLRTECLLLYQTTRPRTRRMIEARIEELISYSWTRWCCFLCDMADIDVHGFRKGLIRIRWMTEPELVALKTKDAKNQYSDKGGNKFESSKSLLADSDLIC